MAPAPGPLSTAEFWSDELGRRRADSLARRRPAHARALGSPADDPTGSVTVDAFAGQGPDAGWPMGTGPQSWDAWGPPPVMHPDHPSAPVPRVRVQVDYNDPVDYTGPLPRLGGMGRHPSGPGSTGRMQGGPGQAGAPWGAQPPHAPADQDFSPPWSGASPQGYVPQGYAAQGYAAQGYAAQGYAWQAYGAAAQAYAEPAGHAEPQAYAQPQGYPGRRTHSGPQDYAPEQDYGGPEAYTAQQRPARPRRPASQPRGSQPGRDRLHAVPNLPDADGQDAPGQPQNYAGAVRVAAEREAQAIREQAAREAAALTREATERAAKIRQAAEEEAAQLRAALAAMSGEMGRVAAFVTENLTVPTIPATRPAETPVTRSTSPSSLRALPTLPDARPERAPASRPPRPAPRPAGPATAPAAPGKEPAKRTRQQNAFRVSKFAVAAGLATVAAVGTTEFVVHGPSFFVFRQGGAGETPGSFTDQQFLAKEHPKPKPKPVKPKPKVVKPATKPTAPAPKASG